MGSSGGIITSSDPGDSVASPGASTDRSVVRFSGVFGDEILDSLFIVSDGGEGSGLTRLDIDNLRLDANTLSATNTNGSLTLSPAGTGQVILTSDLALQKKGSGQLRVTNAAGSTGGQVWAERFYSEAGGAAVGGFEEGNISLASGKHVSWTSGGGAGGTGDVGIKRANVPAHLLATDGSSGLGMLFSGVPVEASTAGVGSPNLLTATESNKLLTNDGAGAEAYNTLPPSAPVGCVVAAYCASANGIRITAPTGETIRTGPGAVSATGGFIRSTVIGSGITLTKINSTSWVAVNAPNGTWTIDT